MEKINCIILEDEKPAQGVLKKYIAEVSYLKLLTVEANPLAAMELLQAQKVDLIFLDINLPKISGLNFLRSLKHPPQVIITTAYPDYALQGFELNVVDYLLKPFSFERFLMALSNLQEKTKPKEITQSDKDPTEPPAFTFEKADNVIYKIEFDKIRYIESDRDYVHICMDDRELKFRQSLKHWESSLPEEHFSRVHKSFIINIGKITQIVGNLVFISNDEIPIGRSYKDIFLKRIFEK